MFAPASSDVTILGGGFAGLAAALRLHRAGAKVRLIEKRAFFGGRAYSFREPKTGETVDNGQHLLMGCYEETFAFLKELGTFDRLDIQKSLTVAFSEGPEKTFELSCPDLPAPLHLAWGLLRYRGLNFRDKRGMARLMSFAKKSAGRTELDAQSIEELLRDSGQTEAAIRKFWEPLALATVNESLELASARLFVEVLRRALLSSKADSRLVLSKVGLSELFANPAQRYFEEAGVPLHFNSQATALRREANGFRVETNRGESFFSDKVLLAIPPNAAAKLLQASGDELPSLLPELHRFGSAPIVSINLWYEGFRPRHRMLGLVDSPIHWVFDKAKILSAEKPEHVTLVVSGAHALAGESKENLLALAESELQKFYPELKGRRPHHGQVVKELEATFSARKGLGPYRPGPRSKAAGIFLAGDWTDTGLPATIEGAVLSGHKAAAAILGV
jgi:hydroxysqualene dehydroxylase